MVPWPDAHHAEENGQQHWHKNTALFGAIKDGKGLGELAVVPHLSHLSLVELHVILRNFWGKPEA